MSVLDENGNTLALIAAIKKNFLVMKMLIEVGVDLEQKNNAGFSIGQIVNKMHNVTLGEAIAVNTTILLL